MLKEDQYRIAQLTKQVTLRAFPVVVVFVLGVGALQNGVVLSERNIHPNLWEQIYYVIGLFGLGGMDLGFPSQGPLFWQYALIFCFFFAPAISLVAIFESLWSFLYPLYRKFIPWKNHIVIIGAGRVGKACAQHLLAEESLKGSRILMVDNQENSLQTGQFLQKRRIVYQCGDIRDAFFVRSLNLQRSRGVLVVTNDSMSNVELASNLYVDLQVNQSESQESTPIPILVRCTDLELKTALSKLDMLSNKNQARLINLNEEIARQHALKIFEGSNKSTGKEDLIVCCFGRFGQTMLQECLHQKFGNQLGDLFQSIHLIDPHIQEQYAWFLHKNPKLNSFSDIIHKHAVSMDSWLFWQDFVLKHGSQDKVIILLNPDENSNLKMAMVLQELFDNSFISLRVFEGSQFAKQLTKHQSDSKTEIHLIEGNAVLKDISKDWINLFV